MKKLQIVFVLLLTGFMTIMSLDINAQIIKPITPKQVADNKKAEDKIKQAAADEAKKKAAIDKVYNAKVTKLVFKIKNYKCAPERVFNFRTASFYHPKVGMGYISFNLDKTDNGTVYDQEFTTPWAKTPTYEKNDLNKLTYKTLMETGFEMFVSFYGRKTEYRAPQPGEDWYANFYVEIFFDNIPPVTISLQGVTVANSKGQWIAKNDLSINKKQIPGSMFPDPANPLVLPVIK